MVEATSHAPSSIRQGWLESQLGLLQFFFLLGWIVYVIFLGDLLARAGIPKEWAPRLLLLDQIVFAGMDLLLGLYADRVQNLLRRLSPLLLTLNLLACLLLACLPLLAGLGPVPLIAATLFWVASSTVLRAPLYGAIARRNAVGATAWAVAGMGVASAVAPYLGVVLKGIDPTLPFVISAIALALASLGFHSWEQQTATQPQPVPRGRSDPSVLRALAAAMLFLGAGFQLHFFLNAAPLFRQVAAPDQMAWLMPVFWVGFSLAVYPGVRLLARLGAARMFAASALLGALASLASATAPGLVGLIGLQALTGACWGISFLAALELAGKAGHHGRESLFIGLLFAVLALTTALRIGLAANLLPRLGTDPLLLAPALWGMGALLATSLIFTRSPLRQTP